MGSIPYVIIDGINFPMSINPRHLREAQAYIPNPGDIFICTYLRCGSAYMQIACLHIMRNGEDLDSVDDIDALSPEIEFEGKKCFESRPSPRLFKTHLPYHRIPLSNDAKYIFLAMHPVENCMAYYEFIKNAYMPDHPFDFDHFFELYMAGDVFFNDYFDHLLGWYPHRNESNCFYTTCDTLRSDTAKELARLAKFLGNESVVSKGNSKKGVSIKSWDYMLEKAQQRGKAWLCRHHNESPSRIKKRMAEKTEIVMSSEQKERLRNKFLEKFEGTEILDWFTWDQVPGIVNSTAAHT